MNAALMERLRQISPEETYYRSHPGRVRQELYTSDQPEEIDQKLLLSKGKLITVRPHSRFVAFPAHRHNYVEMMYVCHGTITHWIDGQRLILKPGDFLLLNQRVMHAIEEAREEDIGINFIALPEFFELPLQMLHRKNVIADFLQHLLCRDAPNAHYLLFRLGGDTFVENMMENMISSLLQDDRNEDEINRYSMGIVFLHLLNHMDTLTQSSTLDYDELVVQSTLTYLDTNYKTAQLSQIANDFHQSLSVLSRLIHEKTGCTFQELLLQKRFEKAKSFLLDTDLAVEEIARAVGYENQSFFFRQFKKRYHQTPRRFRQTHRTAAVLNDGK